MKAWRLAAIALSLVATASGTPANAALDPAHAQVDVDAAMRDKHFPFCSAPHEPLSARALALCPAASGTPGCEGLSAACERASAATPPSPPWWLRWLRLPPGLGVAIEVLIWLLVAALVVAVIVPIVRALGRADRAPPRQVERDRLPSQRGAPETPGTLAATDEEQLLARAEELARRGDLAAALQVYLVAGLRALDRRGVVRIARDRTNGEYVRGCADLAARPPLRALVHEVDRVQFGGATATAAAVDRAARAAAALVRALPAALLLVAALTCLGCGGLTVPRSHEPGDDPAGDELLREVLTRQGVTVRGLAGALASLPLPGPGERAPAVVVAPERTPLDDETRGHLESWVEAGGVLVLAGEPHSWPRGIGATTALASGARTVTARRLLARAVPPSPGEPPDDDGGETAIYSRTEEHGAVSTADGLSVGGERLAWFDDGTSYAAAWSKGSGYVIGVATDELLTNVGLARPGNAAALVAILAATGRTHMVLADDSDGVAPPTTPIAALLRAGLGLGLAHAAAFTVLLFAARGRRLGAARPSPAPRRRAFAEHVEAVGALYARARSAPHALAAYAGFADERVRARMPRGATDVAAFLSSRSRTPLEACQRVWDRAQRAKSGAPPLGDELRLLEDLRALCAATMTQDR